MTADDTVRKQFAPSGTLIVGVNLGNPIIVKPGSDVGEPQGIGPALGKELANRLGLPLRYVKYETAGKLAAAVRGPEWDVAFLAVDPDRATEIDFTDAYVHIEGAYMVPATSDIRSVDDVDRPGRAHRGRGTLRLRPAPDAAPEARDDPALRRVRAIARGVPGRAARGHRRHPPAAAARRRTHRRTARARRQLHDDPPGLGGAQGTAAGARVPRGLHRGRQALGLRGRATAHELASTAVQWRRRAAELDAANPAGARREFAMHPGSIGRRCVQRSAPCLPPSRSRTSHRLQRRPASSSIARRAGCRRTWCLRTMRSTSTWIRHATAFAARSWSRCACASRSPRSNCMRTSCRPSAWRWRPQAARRAS